CQLVDQVVIECVGNTTSRQRPAGILVVGVAPDEIAHEAVGRNDGRPLDGFNILQTGNVGGKTAVHAQDLASHQSSDGHPIEHVH
ncbi:hypothetical protein PFISCL1PPCAC_17116, partial [Pristionchus fissidentatus]